MCSFISILFCIKDPPQKTPEESSGDGGRDDVAIPAWVARSTVEGGKLVEAFRYPAGLMWRFHVVDSATAEMALESDRAGDGAARPPFHPAAGFPQVI